MKNILVLLIILFVGLTCCEGRKTQRQALTEDIEEFKREATIEIDIYNPESYVEREIDTLLSNGYRVKIKVYSDMDNNVLFTKIKDTINYQTYYRNYKFDILVEKEGKRIYFEHFDKNKINNELEYVSNDVGSPIRNFDKHAVLKTVQFNSELTSNEAIYIDVAYAIPNQGFIDWHRLKINSKGERVFSTF